MTDEADRPGMDLNGHLMKTGETMMMVDGKAVSTAFELVSRCGNEVESLSELLAEKLSEAIAGDPTLPVVVGEDVTWEYRNDDNDWVATDIAASLGLKPRGKGNRRVCAFLGFQISMTGDGIGIPGNKEPLLHVFLWDAAIDFDEMWIGFPWGEDEFHVVDDRLMLWGEPSATDWDHRQWQYSLRLLALNTPEDIDAHCIAPVLALLQGGAARDALPDDLPALFTYPEKALLVGR